MNLFNTVKKLKAPQPFSPAKSTVQAHVTIAGTGHYLPPTARLSSTIDQDLARPPGKTEKRTGIHCRPVVGTESSSFMAIAAAKEALADANLKASAIDLILSACAVPEQPIPAMGPLIQRGLGCQQIPAFDVNASCLSFVAAFDMAAQMIESGRFQNILIVSSEIASRALPWENDPDTAAMFGDGAAAIVLSKAQSESSGLLASLMETWSEGFNDCELAAGGTRFDFKHQIQEFTRAAIFKMDGRAAYRLAAKTIEPFLEKLLSKAGWTLADVDLVVPHQASRGALDHLVAKLKIPRHKIIDIILNHGNQIAASIPMALNHAYTSGRIKSGMKVLIVGTSAGFSLGGLCLQMP